MKETDNDLEEIDEAEELNLLEIGTIEEVSKKAAERKRALSKKRAARSKSRGPGKKPDFYDRNSIGRKQYRPKRPRD